MEFNDAERRVIAEAFRAKADKIRSAAALMVTSNQRIPAEQAAALVASAVEWEKKADAIESPKPAKKGGDSK